MQDWLSAVAAKASTLRERLSPDFEQIDGTGSNELIDGRMQAWLAAAARECHEAFRLRLAWDGLDERTARRAVGPVRLRAGVPHPSWTITLAEVLHLSPPSAPDDRCLDRCDPVPFEDLLIPFVSWARSTCARHAGSAYATFSAAAHGKLERHLLKVLCGIAGRTLLVELAANLAEQESPVDRFSNAEPSRDLYNEFVAQMLSGGLSEFLQEYAALARMLASSTTLWVNATTELLQRFSQDRHVIRDEFGISGGCEVRGVEPCVSDLHHGMRSVAILTLDGGERVIYKPRPAMVEAVWNDLLDFCESLSAPADFRTYRILDKGEYCWTEFVQGAPCLSAAEASRYVTRAGALLAIVYLLGGTDCHADNIIPAGEYPVLIDVETMLSPKPRDCSVRSDAPRAAHRMLWQSVLSSYLLPWWSRGINDEQPIDASAFGANPGEAPASNPPRWVDVNTDRMRIVQAPEALERKPAAASADGMSRSVYQHEAELVSGFEAMYRFLASHRSELLHRGSPFQRLRGAAVRFVYRNTATYAAILDRLTRPEFLRDGAERSIEIEQLAYAALTGERLDGRSGWADIWRSERDAVERGDVPHFTAVPGALTLNSGADIVASAWFPECSHDLAIKRLQSLDDSDLRFQVDIIRSAIHSRTARHEADCRSGAALMSLPPGPEDRRAWVSEGVAIARQLAEAAIRGADGSMCWIHRAWSRELEADPPIAELQATGNDLYSGATGIALFFAAVERAAPGSGLLPFALGAIQPLIAELSASGGDVVEQLGLGGLSGIGSAAYALTCMSELLGRPDLMRHAERAADLITEDRIEADVSLDVASGSAGALLALLAVHEVNGNPDALTRAGSCGRRLLARLEEVGGGARAIRTLEGRFLTGFAHGAAGIAYSLCRLFAATGDATFLGGARHLIAFERATYSEKDGNWPDWRHPDAPQLAPSWCHGAAGIGLARLASLDVLHDEETRNEIERALVIAQANAAGCDDCVCCGTFGRVETLWTAGRLLRRPDLCRQAQALAWHSVLRARHSGGHALAVAPVGQFKCLGLFQGLAGIGYTFLRLASPDVVPEVLLLSRSLEAHRRHDVAAGTGSL